jgi:putative DNA primase/helicase
MATDFVETVAGAIVGQLRQGTAPWTRPWAPGQHFLPYNPTTGNTYRGINSLWLLATSQERGYGDSRWLTLAAGLGAGRAGQEGREGHHNPVLEMAGPGAGDRRRWQAAAR